MWRPEARGRLGRRLALVALCQALALPAFATDTVDCSAAEDGEASVSLLLGSGAVLHVARAEVTAGEKTWSTDEGSANPVTVGQAFRDGDRLLIDLADPQSLEVVASIRLLAASEGESSVLAGTLRLVGVGAWALTCVGP
jgi:hypothetical protein